MNRLCFIPTAAAALLLAGCSSSAPQAPIGLAKRPANSPVIVEAAKVPERSVPLLAPNSSTTSPSVIPAYSVGQRSSPALVVISDHTSPGGIQTLPTMQLTVLIQDARNAQTITVYCRGDKAKPSRAQREALLRKGAAAKAFLVAQGVEAGKIHVRVLSAGGFVADNSTPTGRAKNRRIEIRFA